MEFSLFGGALALSRYVPAANVARATLGRAALRAANGRPGAGEVQWAEEVRVWLAATNGFSLGWR